MTTPSSLRQALFLPFVLWAGFVACGLLTKLAAQLMPLPAGGGLTIAVQLSQGFLAATLMAALCSYPLARLYGRRAVVVALLMSVPVLFAALPGLTAPDGSPLAIFLSVWNLLALVSLLVGGTWIAARRRSAA
jgi:hypothetical protein